MENQNNSRNERNSNGTVPVNKFVSIAMKLADLHKLIDGGIVPDMKFSSTEKVVINLHESPNVSGIGPYNALVPTSTRCNNDNVFNDSGIVPVYTPQKNSCLIFII